MQTELKSPIMAVTCLGLERQWSAGGSANMRRSDIDADWVDIQTQWTIRPDTVYLNHGSFGPPPNPVRAIRAAWQQQMDSQPMDFFVRQFEPAWRAARARLAELVDAEPTTLAFVENSTDGMNVIAQSLPLAAGDEVLLGDHEYGAVQRIWRRRCEATGAALRVAVLPARIESAEHVLDAIWTHVTPATRLLVISHITSPTAITLPVAALCQRARQHGLAVCIDGPHAIAQLPLSIRELDCDFYTASCHKWLSAPFGSGFLYVAPRWQEQIHATRLSWGRLPPEPIDGWSDEFFWCGTRDPSAYLAVPAAISFLEDIGWETFRARTHGLARYARQRLVELTGLEPIVPDSDAWYTAMAHVPLPAGNARNLQTALWQQHSIEVPIVEFLGRRYVRVSCHLYNRQQDIDYLVHALQMLLREE
jgi:isopenicillin-N epimerase